jgi:hypothetical protein
MAFSGFMRAHVMPLMASVHDGDIPATLRAYLTPGDAAQRIDLYSDAGRDEIIRALHPARTNAGHWPEDASQKMSLMQQFAINTAFDRLKTNAKRRKLTK